MRKIMQADTFVGETIMVTSSFNQDNFEGLFLLPLNGASGLGSKGNASNTLVAPFNMYIDSITIINISGETSIENVVIRIIKNKQTLRDMIFTDVGNANRPGAFISRQNIGVSINVLDTVSFEIDTNEGAWKEAIFTIMFKKQI
jgi:hypothetical protein